MKHLIAVWLGLLCGAAQAAGEGAAELKQLQQQRSEIEARFAGDSAVCQQRFAVNDCLDEARKRRLGALKPVQARQQVLEEQERRARALAQRERVAERQRDAAIEEGKRVTKTLSAPAPAASAAPVPHPPRLSAQERTRIQQEQAAKAAQDAQLKRAQSAERKLEFERRRRERAERDAQRATQTRKPGITLPVPTAADIAAAASAAASSPKR